MKRAIDLQQYATVFSGGYGHWFVVITVVIDVISGVLAVASFAVFVMAVYGRIRREAVPPHMFRQTLFLPALFSAFVWLQFHTNAFVHAERLITLKDVTPSVLTSALIGASVSVWIATLFVGGGGNCEK